MPSLSPRHLVHRQIAQTKAALSNSDGGDDDDASKPPLPNPGDMQLYSFYEPSLHQGTYTITAKQQISIPGEAVIPDQTCPDQKFTVVAPQFTIPPADIHSTYPPQGHADQPNILPHIVFSDPHLPWERLALATDQDEMARPDNDINKIPWMALLVFDCNGPDQELRLTDDQLNGPKSIFPSAMQSPALKQQSNFAVDMTVHQYMSLPTQPPPPTNFKGNRVIIPAFNPTDFTGDTTPIEVIFLTATLFNAFFASKADPAKIDVSRYRYLSHVRNINTTGMADAAALGEDTGLFSIIHSHRTGPWNVQQGKAPRSQVVHLVTIENVSEMTSVPSGTDMVGLVSLYSWTYLCQPPLSVNFVDSMRAIGFELKQQGAPTPPRNTCMLRAPDELCFPDPPDAAPTQPAPAAGVNVKPTNHPNAAPIQPGAATNVGTTTNPDATTLYSAKVKIRQRLQHGYTLVRHRAASGEETVAFTRGALIPVPMPERNGQWPISSNNGQCYQILDRDLGIMDVSYSAAWQLGKALAVGDSGFVAALMRVRGEAWTAGTSAAKEENASNRGFKTKVNVLSSLHTTVLALGNLNHGNPPGLDQRWRDTSVTPSTPGFKKLTQNPAMAAAFVGGVKAQVDKLTSGTHADGSIAVHNEVTTPVSPDWALVHSWIMDKLYLGSIPNHYLITDPCHLPPESIRFFNIDPVWMDCLIDGSLSVANHLSRTDDIVRLNLKRRFNDYLTTNLSDENLPHFPQVPVYGFFLRSKVVSVFPDLRVSVPYPSTGHQGQRLEVIAQKNMGKDVLMVLLDRYPDGGEMKSITISQPPHQQCFSAGDGLDDKTLEFLFRKIYPPGVTPPKGLWDDLTQGNIIYHADRSLDDPKAQPSPIYSWTTRCLDMDVFAKVLTSPATTTSPGGLLQQFMPGTAAVSGKAAIPGPWQAPNDTRMTSAMVGLELNDEIMFLELDAPPVGKNLQKFSTSRGDARQLWTGAVSTSTGSADGTSTGSKNLRSMQSGKAVKVAANAKPEGKKPDASQPGPNQPAPKQPSPAQATPKQSVIFPTVVSPTTKMLAPTTFINHATGPRPIDTKVPTQPSPGFGSPAPQYTFAVFPSTISASLFPPFQPQSFVYVDCPNYVDLIFSLSHVKNLTKQNLDLFSVEIHLPLGSPSIRPLKTDIPGPGLMDTYQGTGARMLSNQRFVVHIDLQLPKMLVLRLIPRTLQYTTKLFSNPELTFKLSGCAISTDLTDGKRIGTKVIETYRRRRGTVPETWDEEGIANNNFVTIERRTGFGKGVPTVATPEVKGKAPTSRPPTAKSSGATASAKKK